MNEKEKIAALELEVETERKKNRELREALELEVETERKKNRELRKSIQDMERSRRLIREPIAAMVMRFRVLYPYGDEITKSTVVRDVQVDLEEILRTLDSES